MYRLSWIMWCESGSIGLSSEWCNDVIREVGDDEKCQWKCVESKMELVVDFEKKKKKKEKKGRLIDFCFFFFCSRICIYSGYCYYCCCCCLNTWIKELTMQLPVHEHWNCHEFSSILFWTCLQLISFQHKKGIDV